jgi:hypothetical protein
MGNDITFRTATAQDAALFYDGAPPLSFRGKAAEQSGVVIALFGISYDKGTPVAFSQITDAMRENKKALLKGCKIMMQMVDDTPGAVYAVADPDEPTAPYLLIRFGWRPTGRFTAFGELMVRSETCS